MSVGSTVSGGGDPGRRVRIVGPGRAGGSFARALAAVGWSVSGPLGRDADLRGAAHGVDVVLLAVPDRVVGEVADRVGPDEAALVVHCAGSLGLDVLGAHPRRGSLHPLVSLPDPVTGAARLASGAWFAVAADRDADRMLLGAVVEDLSGHAVVVADGDRVAYHAAASIASNHLVALFGQVQRVAASTGVPLEAFLGLASQTLAGLYDLDPAAALTGPVARGDWATVAAHLAAIEGAERPAYAALAEAAARLVAERDGSPDDAVDDTADDTVDGVADGVARGPAGVPTWLASVRRGETVPMPARPDHPEGSR